MGNLCSRVYTPQMSGVTGGANKKYHCVSTTHLIANAIPVRTITRTNQLTLPVNKQMNPEGGIDGELNLGNIRLLETNK